MAFYWLAYGQNGQPVAQEVECLPSLPAYIRVSLNRVEPTDPQGQSQVGALVPLALDQWSNTRSMPTRLTVINHTVYVQRHEDDQG